MSGLDARTERSIKEVAHLLLAREGQLRLYQEVAEAAGRSTKWVTQNLNPLVLAGVVEAKPLRFGRACGCALGIAMGTESLRAALVDANGVVHHPHEAPDLPDQLGLSKDALLARIGETAAAVLAKGLGNPALREHRGRLPVLGVTVAWPTPVDRDFMRAGAPLRDRAWGDEPLPAPLARLLGGPFARPTFSHAINDANAAVMALAYDEAVARIGQPDGERSQILMALRLSGGIGAGTIELTPHRTSRLSFLDSSLIVGTSGFAGEIGHLPTSRSVVEAIQKFSGPDPDSPDPAKNLASINVARACSCGVKGDQAELADIGAAAHLEAIAGALAFADRLRSSGYEVAGGRAVSEQVGKLLERRDREIERALWECGALVGRAMAAPILMLDPAKIMLTGFLAREAVRTGFVDIRARSKRTVTNKVTVEVSREDDYLEVRGAALATVRGRCWREIDEDPLVLASRPRAWTTAHLKKLRERVAQLRRA
jgi:predicted NBD/HSP70 family sugar kinase